MGEGQLFDVMITKELKPCGSTSHGDNDREPVARCQLQCSDAGSAVDLSLALFLHMVAVHILSQRLIGDLPPGLLGPGIAAAEADSLYGSRPEVTVIQ